MRGWRGRGRPVARSMHGTERVRVRRHFGRRRRRGVARRVRTLARRCVDQRIRGLLRLCPRQRLLRACGWDDEAATGRVVRRLPVALAFAAVEGAGERGGRCLVQCWLVRRARARMGAGVAAASAAAAACPRAGGARRARVRRTGVLLVDRLEEFLQSLLRAMLVTKKGV
jgi:hypothetical protein